MGFFFLIGPSQICFLTLLYFLRQCKFLLEQEYTFLLRPRRKKKTQHRNNPWRHYTALTEQTSFRQENAFILFRIYFNLQISDRSHVIPIFFSSLAMERDTLSSTQKGNFQPEINESTVNGQLNEYSEYQDKGAFLYPVVSYDGKQALVTRTGLMVNF